MGRRILIVDDEPNIVASLEYLLTRSGYDVRVASNGEEALAETSRFDPELVLLDVMMPRVNGFEVCERIRKGPAGGKVKIVMLTARGRDVDMSKGVGLGADLYVTKPFSTQQLVLQVKELLGPAP